MVDAKLNLTTSVQRLEYVYSIDNQVGPPGKRVDVTLPELTGPVEAFEDRDGLWSRLRYISGRYVAAGKGMSLLSVSPESRLILIRHVLQGGTVDKTKPFSALKPAGVYEVPLVKSHWPRSVSVTLENGLRCEEIGLVASPLLDDHVAGLLEIESTVSGDDTGRLPSAMTKAFQARISEILLQLKGLRDFVSRSLAGVGNFVKGSEPSDLENRVGAAVSHLNAVDYGGTLAEFRQKLSDAAQSLREPIRVHWTTKQLNVELPDSEYVGLEQVIVPISPEPRHRNHADGRIGTTWCLALLAVALFALSWRRECWVPDVSGRRHSGLAQTPPGQLGDSCGGPPDLSCGAHDTGGPWAMGVPAGSCRRSCASLGSAQAGPDPADLGSGVNRRRGRPVSRYGCAVCFGGCAQHRLRGVIRIGGGLSCPSRPPQAGGPRNLRCHIPRYSRRVVRPLRPRSPRPSGTPLGLLHMQRQRGQEQRLVVAIFASDGVALLSTALGVFVDGPDAFTLDGSVAASTSNVASMCFVLKKVNSGGQPEPNMAAADLEELINRLEGRLRDALPEAKVRVDELRENSESLNLFVGRHLGEVRFGVDVSDGRDWSVQCGAMVSEVASYLRDRSIPISYIYGPFVWRSRTIESGYFTREEAEDLRWVRIGYGLTGSWGSDFLHGVHFENLANRYGWHFGFYSASLNEADGFAGRFVIERCSEPIAETSEESEATDMAGHDGSVVMSGESECRAQDVLDAEIGLVSRLVGLPDQPRSIDGISMAALVGKTMISVVGNGPFDELDAVAVNDAVPTRALANEARDSFWIAWRCADRPGIAARVVGTFEKFLGEVGCDGLQIEYSVTRALQDGETCAGKLRVAGPAPSVAQAMDDKCASELERLLTASLESALSGWDPPYASWRENPVQVKDFEPTEEPWATLALRAGLA